MPKQGFTLVEFVMAVAIMISIVFGVTNLARDVLVINTSATQNLVAQSDARKALKSIIAELRTAAPSSTGAYTIESASSTSVIFFADLDNDNRTERIRYYLDYPTRTLRRGVVVPTGNPPSYVLGQETYTTLSSDIVISTTTPVFEYFNTNYAGTSSPLTYPIDVSVIRLVRVRLIIDKDPNRAPLEQITTSEVTLRNLKDNL